VSRWEALDPIKRYRRYLATAGLLSEADAAQHEEAAEAAAMDFRARLADVPDPTTEEMFDFVYAEPPAGLRLQRELAAEQHADG